MPIVTPDRFNQLKSRVKTEMTRRAGTGSVSAYGGTDYDYTNACTSGNQIKKEHYEKIAIPLNAINNTKITETSGERIISESEIVNMEAQLAIYEARTYTDNSGTDCATSCTGACYSCTGACTSGCTGCSGCGGSCSYGCSGGCSSSCTGSCSGGCSVGCSSGVS